MNFKCLRMASHGLAVSVQSEPHVYALAEAAYSTMRRMTKDCVVIISGTPESLN